MPTALAQDCHDNPEALGILENGGIHTYNCEKLWARLADTNVSMVNLAKGKCSPSHRHNGSEGAAFVMSSGMRRSEQWERRRRTAMSSVKACGHSGEGSRMMLDAEVAIPRDTAKHDGEQSNLRSEGRNKEGRAA